MPIRRLSRSRRVSMKSTHRRHRDLVVAADGEVVLGFALARPVEGERGDAAREKRLLVGVGLFLAGVEAAHDMTSTGGRSIPGGFRRMPASGLPSYGICTRSPGGLRYGSARLRHSTAFMCAVFICEMSCTNRNFAEVIVDAGALQMLASAEEAVAAERLAADRLVLRGARRPGPAPVVPRS